MLETGASWIWIVVHFVGALVMLAAWHRYRQSFFPWSAAKWTSQAFVVWLAPMQGVVLIVVRLIGAVTGIVAVYLVVRMMRRQRRFVTVVAAKDGQAMIRRGLHNHVLEVPEAELAVDEDQVDTPRPKRN